MSKSDGSSRVLEILRANPVFAGGDEGALAALAQKSTIIELPSGHILFRNGDPARAVYVLASGLIRVYQKAGDDREVTITNLLPPTTFGEMEVIAEATGQPRVGYVEYTMALKPSTVVEIPAADFVAFLGSDATSALELLKDVCSRFCHNALREVDVMLEVPVRLASLILSYAEVAGQTSPEGVVIKLPLTHDDLAKGLGVAVKSIARTLKDWQTNGWVTRHKGWFVLRDAEAIEKLCGSNRFPMTYSYQPAAVDPEGSST